MVDESRIGLVDIRSAAPTDADAVCPMIVSSEPETFEYVYRDPHSIPKDFVRFEFLSGRGFFGYPQITVAECEGRVAGVGCLYAGSRGSVLKTYGPLLRGSIFNLVMRFRTNSWKYMARARHLDAIMRTPKPREAYLSSFFVDPLWRRRGVGSAMLKHWVEQARRHGCESLWLDTSDDNATAQTFYLNLGFRVTATKPFRGYREGFSVRDAKEMMLNLASKTPFDLGAKTDRPKK